MSDYPIPIWSGSFCIFGVDVKCHTLSDGQRIVEAGSMEKLFAADMGNSNQGDLAAFVEWHKGGSDAPSTTTGKA